MQPDSNCQVYLISTDDSIGERRRGKIKGYLSQINVKYVISSRNDSNYGIFEAKVEKFISGTMGCANAHLKTWEQFLESPNDYALIIEDDACLDALDEVICQIKSEKFTRIQSPMLIQFGWLSLGKLTLKRYLVALYHVIAFRGGLRGFYSRSYGFGNHLYFINRKMAERLILLLTGFPAANLKKNMAQCQLRTTIMPWDLFIQSSIDLPTFRDCVVLRSSYNFANQEGADSNITDIKEWVSEGGAYGNRLIKRFRNNVISFAEAKNHRVRISDIEELR